MSSFLRVAKKLSATALMLLCQERDGSGVVEVGDEQRVEAAGEVAHEAAADLAAGLAFLGAALDVGLGLGVVLHADHRDRVERVVGLPVTAAVEAVTGRSCRLTPRRARRRRARRGRCGCEGGPGCRRRA